MGAITDIAGACFENLIGIRELCTPQVPTSGLMLNQTGINLDFIKSIIMKDYRDPQQFVDDKIAFATKLVTDQVARHFSAAIRTSTILAGARAGQATDNKKLKAAEAGQLKGINVQLCNKSSYLDFFLSEITLFTNFSGTVPVIVYDLVQGIQIDTFNVTTTAGQISRAIVNRLYKSNKKRLDIIIVYDITAIGQYETLLSLSGCTSCGAQEGQVLSTPYVDFSSIKIASASAKLRENLVFTSDTGGMSLVYSIQCNKTDWQCENSNLLALPILYKAAAEIYLYGTISDRENSRTLISGEVMEKRYASSEGFYQDTMRDLMPRIQLPKHDKCFHCNRQSANVVILP